jgi:hypothetical protein
MSPLIKKNKNPAKLKRFNHFFIVYISKKGDFWSPLILFNDLRFDFFGTY